MVTLNIIKPNSLPLQIYKGDRAYDSIEQDSNKLYHSFVEPSVVKSCDIRNCVFDRYQFEYACFGSDAQAIHL